MKNPNVAVYSRIANTNDELIGRQENSLLQYARLNGIAEDSDCVCFRDNGVSGITMDRPGLKKLMAAIRDGEVGAVIVKDSSRIARDLHCFMEWMEFAQAHCVEVISVNDGSSLVGWFELTRTWMSALK